MQKALTDVTFGKRFEQGRFPINSIFSSTFQRSAIGYVAGALAASLLYICWIAFVVAGSGPDAHQSSLGFRFGFAAFFWVAGGFGPTLLALIFPWLVVVSLYKNLRLPGWIYFPVVAALLVFALGCAISSVMPKPFFVDEQTFLQGALVTARREGICLLLAGIAFGAAYWFFGERQTPAQENQESTAH
jgi:hypothetical protein